MREALHAPYMPLLRGVKRGRSFGLPFATVASVLIGGTRVYA